MKLAQIRAEISSHTKKIMNDYTNKKSIIQLEEKTFKATINVKIVNQGDERTKYLLIRNKTLS